MSGWAKLQGSDKDAFETTRDEKCLQRTIGLCYKNAMFPRLQHSMAPTKDKEEKSNVVDWVFLGGFDSFSSSRAEVYGNR